MVQLNTVESLEEANKHEGRFIVRELLTQTDSWASVEWHENEWVWCQILMQTFVDEAVRIEFIC